MSEASRSQKRKRGIGNGIGNTYTRRNDEKSRADGVEFDMKKARYDIIKFAMTGLSGTDKHNAETNLAISLGAKPPKPTYVNYKELQATRKKEKEEQLLLRKISTKPKPFKINKNTNDNTTKTKTKKPIKHSLETTGIYKVKFPPGSSKSKNNFKSQRGGNRRFRN